MREDLNQQSLALSSLRPELAADMKTAQGDIVERINDEEALLLKSMACLCLTHANAGLTLGNTGKRTAAPSKKRVQPAARQRHRVSAGKKGVVRLFEDLTLQHPKTTSHTLQNEDTQSHSISNVLNESLGVLQEYERVLANIDSMRGRGSILIEGEQNGTLEQVQRNGKSRVTIKLEQMMQLTRTLVQVITNAAISMRGIQCSGVNSAPLNHSNASTQDGACAENIFKLL